MTIKRKWPKSINRKVQQKVNNVLKKNYARILKSLATKTAASKLMEDDSILEFRAEGQGVSRIIKAGFKVKQAGREYKVIYALTIGVEPAAPSPPTGGGEPKSGLLVPSKGAGKIVEPSLSIIKHINGGSDGPQRKRASNL